MEFINIAWTMNHDNQAMFLTTVRWEFYTITIWDTEGGTNYSCEPLIINNVEIVASQVAAPKCFN